MNALLPSLLAAFFYAVASFYYGVRVFHRQQATPRLAIFSGAIALICHSAALFLQLLASNGLQLEFFTAASLIVASVIALTLAACLKLAAQNLLLLLFPIGCISVLLAAFMPIGTPAVITSSAGIIAHILFSILAYGLLSMAMLQSLLVLLQDHQLKKKQLSGLSRTFAPLQTMESLLFAFVWAGWLLLTLSLLSGWLFLDDLFAQHLVHKTLLSGLAWLVFAILLWGRHQLGWRGHQAIRWTLAGFCLLMLAYFGSKLVREFILHV